VLDVRTEKGRQAELLARQAVLKLQKPGQVFAWYPDSNYYPVDGFIVQGNDITALFECKAREMAFLNGKLEHKNRAYDSLILSESKIINGANMAKEMCLDFYLLAYMALSGHCLIFKLYDSKDDKVINYEAKTTKTQATVNGGEAIRSNAFLKVCNAAVRLV
jgi:hypothetical protein